MHWCYLPRLLNILFHLFLFFFIFVISLLLFYFMCNAQMMRCWGITIRFLNGKRTKGGQTLKNILVSPKDKDSMTNRNSVIYSYSCRRIDCDEEDIEESARTFGERYKEHLKAPSPIFGHQNSSDHKTSMENFQIIGREENSMVRTIKEAMYIRVNNPTLNRNIGKYNLSHIWDRVLFTIPELKINK